MNVPLLYPDPAFSTTTVSTDPEFAADFTSVFDNTGMNSDVTNFRMLSASIV